MQQPQVAYPPVPYAAVQPQVAYVHQPAPQPAGGSPQAPMVAMATAIPMPGQQANLDRVRIAAALKALRKISIGLVVVGLLGLVPTALYLGNILAIATGGVVLGQLPDVDQAIRIGTRQVSSSIFHARNLAIATMVLVGINMLYALPSAIVGSIYTFGRCHPYYHFPSCSYYHSGGYRFWVVSCILGLVWGVVLFPLCIVFLSRLREVAMAAGDGFLAGSCCYTSTSGPAPTSMIIQQVPASGMMVYPNSQAIYVQPQSTQAYIMLGPTGAVTQPYLLQL